MLKKISILIILLCTPLTAMAMEALSDKDLGKVSGQTGVSIMVDITMDLHIDVLAWGDADGLGNGWSMNSKGGYVSGKNVSVTGLSVSNVSSNSVSLIPDVGSINIVNGVPYYQGNTGTGLK